MGKSIKLLQDREAMLLESAQKLEYKEISGGENLSLYFYFPSDFEEEPSRPLLLFFPGGGWDRASVAEFGPHALYFVERGAVCGLVEYRNSSSHPDSQPLDSLSDGMSAIRYVRQHAEKLHIDPDKVIACGAGAGGNIAANVALNAQGQKREASGSKPNAAVLFSPVIEVTQGSYGSDRFQNPNDYKQVNLLKHAEAGAPPVLLMHGTEDRLVPLSDAALFADRMKKRKNSCELVEFEGRDRNFYNWNFDPASFEICLSTMDEFLDSYGFLSISPADQSPHLISWREEDY